MKFFKNLFGKTDPEVVIRNKLTELEIPDHAIYLSEAINEEDQFRIVRDIAENLIDQGIYTGILIGKKGWFLPNGQEKVKAVWKDLEKHMVNLDSIANTWQINKKRVFIALEEYAHDLNLEEPIFHQVDDHLYLMSYFKKAWYDILAAYDEDHETEFDKLMQNAKVHPDSKVIFQELAREWLADEGGRYALGSDNMVRPKSIVPELIEELVPELWKVGKPQITYEELSRKYGMTTTEIGKILQKLIDENALGEVTLYATDELIKPRMT